jgi:hypothetical protein
MNAENCRLSTNKEKPVQQQVGARFVSADPFFSSRRKHLVAVSARQAQTGPERRRRQLERFWLLWALAGNDYGSGAERVRYRFRTEHPQRVWSSERSIPMILELVFRCLMTRIGVP